ncbi:MAG: MBL fold metallo-hydrolase [Candidatus Latescibacterota bacterium]
MIADVHWLGHASFKITGTQVIYMDPWKVKDGEKADLILITHPHHDHCSQDDVAKIWKNGTEIVAVADCEEKLLEEILVVSPGDTRTVQGIPIEVVPAYNTDKPFHPVKNAWAGFVVTVAGARIYHAGDTDWIPEMVDVRADIALLPIGGTYTMTASEASQAAVAIAPKTAIPMHWGDIVGSRADAEQFAKRCAGKVVVEILGAE